MSKMEKSQLVSLQSISTFFHLNWHVSRKVQGQFAVLWIAFRFVVQNTDKPSSLTLSLVGIELKLNLSHCWLQLYLFFVPTKTKDNQSNVFLFIEFSEKVILFMSKYKLAICCEAISVALYCKLVKDRLQVINQ